MPKAILEFNLPEEREEFELAQNGQRYKIQLEDLWEELRKIWKYEEVSDDQMQMLERVKEIYLRVTGDE